MESSSTFSIESHNLSERLGNNHLEALVEEVSETVSISVEESRSEALVGSVEEGEKVVLGTDVSDHSPLFLSGINTSRVVGTSVEEDNRSRLGVSEILKHSVDVESLGLGNDHLASLVYVILAIACFLSMILIARGGNKKSEEDLRIKQKS